jgi:S1-C subfamily serine protease
MILSNQIKSQTFWNEISFKKYLTENISNLDPLEGIWSVNRYTAIKDKYNRVHDSSNNPQESKYAIQKKDDNFIVYILPEFSILTNVKYSKTAAEGFYLVSVSNPDWYKDSKANAIMNSDGVLEYTYEAHFQDAELNTAQGSIPVKVIHENSLIKLFPTKVEYEKKQKITGTGFAISSNGLIVTNYHVVENVKQIKVRGINGDFEKSYLAKIESLDKNNDLAIIKIDDISFKSLGLIPYGIKDGTSEVGENVNVLGYPLTATMGEEIKFTNGIISSKSGYKGDITCYQCSAPVQPGNSGGPVFDKQGNIIAVVNAKHLGAENVSYAIKSNYLINLINSLPYKVKPTINNIFSKSLTEKIKNISNYVYIIEN